MKIKKEHLLDELTVKTAAGFTTRILGDLSRAEVKQYVAAGFISPSKIEETKSRKKKKEDGAEVQDTMVEPDNGQAD